MRQNLQKAVSKKPIREFIFALLLIVLLIPLKSMAVRSALYPEDWTPGFTDAEGRFLHDVSYCGYHNGELPLPLEFSLPAFNVVSGFGADNTGSLNATAAIQSAIDAAETAGGGVVYLPEGLYRCDGRLIANASNIVLKGDGPDKTQLYFTSYSGMANLGHIYFHGTVQREADILLAEDGENRSFVVKVNDATSLNVGDEVAVGWIITDEFVDEHGMTGTWVTFNGLWKPFFRREITAINSETIPHEVTFDVPLRYSAKVRDGASLRREHGYLSECAIVDIALSNAVDYESAWAQNQVHVLTIDSVKDSFIRNVRSFASPLPSTNGRHLQSSGISLSATKRVTVRDCQMELAQNREGGGNGYLMEVRYSNEVLFQDCTALDGRHNFIQNWDFGAAGIVWHRCYSEGSTAVTRVGTYEISVPAFSEYHHSLTMACLADSCVFVDGWSGGNRESESSGAGHSVTQSIVWNIDGAGEGRLRSFNYGHGYVIGTKNIDLYIESDILFGNLDEGTEPYDFTEAVDAADALEPQSLYEDQLGRRLGGLVESRVRFEAESQVVQESDGQISLPVRVDGAPRDSFSVDVVVAVSGTTASEDDYLLQTTTVNWQPGNDVVGTVLVDIMEDEDIEGSETVVVELTNPSIGLRLIEPARSTLTILDNDELIEGEGLIEREGEGVSEGEGIIEGEGEGIEEEGTLEGPLEGLEEGALEGQEEGMPSEGATEEGQAEGMIEGEEEGAPEGIGEGEEEGAPEGIGEGEEEGEGQIEGEGEGESGCHSADQDCDGYVNLSELLRIIQFFNSNGYHCQAGTEDGFAPGPGDMICAPHQGDYNPQDWRIALSELLRMIQFFNSGGYHFCPGEDTEDGYCPGKV
ncbi:MAG TPA: glycosyl hydrolase family 28-related protein [Candidatus Hydrogenedentes bacterium]|nr:glycosyl hydrolase family 28-related protein [Candidatus Hydrogenedentota bacterium]